MIQQTKPPNGSPLATPLLNPLEQREKNQALMMDELNKLIEKMRGLPMTPEQIEYRDKLRELVRTKKITVEEAHSIWNKKWGLP